MHLQIPQPSAIFLVNLECFLQAKIDKKFDIAFGIGGLVQLASGYALVLILAGENVRPHIQTVLLAAHTSQGCSLRSARPFEDSMAMLLEKILKISKSGLYLQVGTLREHLVWKVTKTAVLADSAGSGGDAALNNQ